MERLAGKASLCGDNGLGPAAATTSKEDWFLERLAAVAEALFRKCLLNPTFYTDLALSQILFCLIVSSFLMGFELVVRADDARE